ncbi:MAG: hypothetical protein DRO12_04875 [Thermoprotei archaeon]|nr:MAG: hypothetical protein DRO12_04875 [Thermoprotei archaeon]
MSKRERNISTEQRLKELFRDYYLKAPLHLPPDFNLREFAFQLFGSSGYIRHKAFLSEAELRNFVVQHVPKHMYFSAAKYLDPARPNMDEKMRIGTDLVFDIDADHIPKCEEVLQVLYLCPRCGAVIEKPRDTCEVCGSKLIEYQHIPEDCLEEAARITYLLTDVITNELGHKIFTITFSGHRGFHIHVQLNEEEGKMGSEARRELLQYLLGEGTELEQYLVRVVKKRRRIYVKPPPRIVEGGWRRRIALFLLHKIQDYEIRTFIEGKKQAINTSKLTSIADEINKLIQEAITAMRIIVDEKVLIDLSRLIRVPESINGKAGFIVKRLTLDELTNFKLDETLSPFASLELKILPKVNMPKLRLLGKDIRLKRGVSLRIDGALGVYLALKGLAEIIEVL